MVHLGDGLVYDPVTGRINTSGSVTGDFINSSYWEWGTNGMGIIGAAANPLLSTTGGLTQAGLSGVIANILNHDISTHSRRLARFSIIAGLGNDIASEAGLSPGSQFMIGLGTGAIAGASYYGLKKLAGENKSLSESANSIFSGKIAVFLKSIKDETGKAAMTKSLGTLSTGFRVAQGVHIAGEIVNAAGAAYAYSLYANKNRSTRQNISQSAVYRSFRNKTTSGISQADVVNTAALLSSVKAQIDRISQPARASFYNRT